MFNPFEGLKLENRILNFLRGLDWRVLLAVPVLSVLLGVANNMRVSEEQRVRWSGVRSEKASDEIAAQDVKRGVWTSNFDVATNLAASAHVPVVVVVTLGGCGYCSSLRKVLNGVAVRSWQKERGWYFVLVDRKKCERAYELVRNTPFISKTPPYVGVYWTHADGTKTMRNFPGRQGMMGVKREKMVALEWILAVEASVPGAPGLENGVAAATIVNEAKVRVETAVDERNGAAGRVRKVPDIDAIIEGQKVTLTAEPQRGSVFAGWRYPDGNFVYEKSRLVVGTDFMGGTYTAVFLRPEDCAKPVLQLPEGEVEWTEMQFAELKLRVDSDDYPVVLSCRGLPLGMRLLSRTEGVISGRPMTNGVWKVEVKAEGISRQLPTVTGTFTVRVAPQAHPPGNAGTGEKDEDN